MLFAVSRHIGWMPSTTTTMWLHFYCIEDRAWIADRFLVVLPPRWRVVWTFLRPIGAKSVSKSYLNFCAQGDSITGHGHILPCLSIFLPLREHFLLWNMGKNWHGPAILLVLPKWFWSTPTHNLQSHKLLADFSRFYMLTNCVRHRHFMDQLFTRLLSENRILSWFHKDLGPIVWCSVAGFQCFYSSPFCQPYDNWMAVEQCHLRDLPTKS